STAKTTMNRRVPAGRTASRSRTVRNRASIRSSSLWSVSSYAVGPGPACRLVCREAWFGLAVPVGLPQPNRLRRRIRGYRRAVAASSGPAQWAYRAFRALPSPVRDLGDTVLRLRAERSARALPAFPDEPTRLLIGPLNTAGQSHRWAQAARQLPGVAAKSLNVERR